MYFIFFLCLTFSGFHWVTFKLLYKHIIYKAVIQFLSSEGENLVFASQLFALLSKIRCNNNLLDGFGKESRILITAPAKWNKIKCRLEIRRLIIAGFLPKKLLLEFTVCVFFHRCPCGSRRSRIGSMPGSCSMRRIRSCAPGWSKWKAKCCRLQMLALKTW